nr:hypothetical protein [Tanacetum cinerariifolium]
MDVKRAFLYGTIKEEVYVCQPQGFEDLNYPDKRGNIDQTLFIKKQKGDILLVQMSSMGELTFFLGLQVKHKQDGIFISQDKYVAEILRKFDLTGRKLASTPIDTKKPLLKDADGEDVDVHRYRYLKGKPHLGLWYPKDSPFNLVAYLDFDYAGASLDRKSTTGGCQFLGCRLISWQCKKQIVVATSSTEMDVKRAFLYGTIKEEVYVCQPQGFEDPNYPDKTNDVMRLQALIDRKKVIIIEDTVRKALHLDDDDSIDCLPNEEIFAYLVRNVDSFSKFYMYPRFLQLMIAAQVGDLSSHTTEYTSPALKQKVFANMRREGKGDTPLFEGMLVPQQATDDIANVVVDDVDDVVAEDAAEPTRPSSTPTITLPPTQEIPSTSQDKIAQALEIIKLRKRVRRFEKKNKLKVSGLRRLKKEVDAKKDAEVAKKDIAVQGRQEESQAQAYHIDLEYTEKVLKEKASRALKRKTESSEQQAAKKQKLDGEVEELKKHLQIVSNDEDDVYTEATPLALKVPVTYCYWYKLKLLDTAADSRLRLLEQSAAVDDKMKK